MAPSSVKARRSAREPWCERPVSRVEGREKPLTSAGDRALVGGLGSVPDPGGLPPAHNCMKRSTDDVQHHPQHQTSPVPGERHDPSRRPAKRARRANASAAPARHSRGEADRGAEPMLGRPRFEPLLAGDAEQAVELLARLIAAAARGRDDQDGQVADSGRVSSHQRDEDASRRRSRVANGCPSDWQAKRRENGGSVAVSGGSPAPDCIGRSRSSVSS